MDNSDIKVDVTIQTEEKDQIERLNKTLTPNVSTLAFQIRKLVQDIELVSRAVLYKKYADGLIELANSSKIPTGATTVKVDIKLNDTLATSLEGNKVELSVKGINEMRPFSWETINSAKETLAMISLSLFDRTEKEPVTLNGIPVRF